MTSTVADLRGGAGDARPPLGAQILSISCSFWENLAKSYVGAPPWGVGAPSSGKSWIRHWSIPSHYLSEISTQPFSFLQIIAKRFGALSEPVIWTEILYNSIRTAFSWWYFCCLFDSGRWSIDPIIRVECLTPFVDSLFWEAKTMVFYETVTVQ